MGGGTRHIGCDFILSRGILRPNRKITNGSPVPSSVGSTPGRDRASCGKETVPALSMTPCAILMVNVSRLSHPSSCRTMCTRSLFRIENIRWKIYFTVEKRSLREPSIDFSGIPGLCGSEAILIDLCGMKNISATVFATSAVILRKPI